jgi:CheY-like chemotaxis protein/nitrogen-specific signal transduction histidine kinase
MAKSISRSLSKTRSADRSAAGTRKAKRAAAPAKKAGKRGLSPRAIESALATFAHDIRTPLTGIVAFSELLATSGLGERESRWVEAIKDSATHLAELTTLAVEAARAGAGRLRLRRETFALPHFAGRLAFSLAARAEAKGLACETSIPDDLPEEVIGDPVLLRAAIENLMANAVKFTERGQVELRIEAQALPRAKLRLSVTVSDSGIGISDAELSRLFRPFAQASKEVGLKFGGSGLGLVQVRRLARSMHGDLKVESVPGQGSTFRLTVTLDRARGAAGAAAARALPHGEALDILCVEDNPYGRVVMNALVTELGHRATFAGSADAALTALAQGSADAVLMDVALPGVDGYEATRRIRALPGCAGRVAVIGICADQSPPAAQAAAAAAAGMNACLVKPLSPRMLADALAKARGGGVAAEG